MPYLIDIKEELSEQVQEQLRKFRSRCSGSDALSWYYINAAVARARDTKIYHGKIEDYIVPNLFDEKGDPIYWYHFRDPQESQVRMVKQNLKIASEPWRGRGSVTPYKLRQLMKEILQLRINQYENPRSKDMDKLKILCILGESGAGKTLASLHLKYHKDANVICSFTTRTPRETEVEGRDHHFIDIVPDRTDMLAYAHFGGDYYYALKEQVYGPCTVYVVDEKGLKNLRTDWGNEYDIYTVLIRRKRSLRIKCDVDLLRIKRDDHRVLHDEDYDYVIENNGSKKSLFESIERIYEEVKEK